MTMPNSVFVLSTSTTTTDRPPPFLRLPAELRLAIYDLALPPTKTRSLYIHRNVYAWQKRCIAFRKSQTYMNLMLVCRQIHEDTSEILYNQHELSLYTDLTTNLDSREVFRHRLCGIEDYYNVFMKVHKIRLTIFVTGENRSDSTLSALLGYLKAVLAERKRPIKSLTIEMCATHFRACKPTAILYAAQGFRSFGPTRFLFQNGFSGVGSESAMEALMQHANEKINERPAPDTTKEEALKKLFTAWEACQPTWYNPRRLSNRWFGTTLEV